MTMWKVIIFYYIHISSKDNTSSIWKCSYGILHMNLLKEINNWLELYVVLIIQTMYIVNCNNHRNKKMQKVRIYDAFYLDLYRIYIFTTN